MLSLEALYQKLKGLFQEGILATESTLSELNSKVTAVDTGRIEDIWDYAVSNDKAFVVNEVFNVDPSTPLEVVFINPPDSGKTLKVRLLQVRGRVDGEVELHDDPVITTSGTALDIVNKKTGGTNTSVAIVEYGGSYTGYSTKRTRGIITGGTGNFAVGGISTTGLAGEVVAGHGKYIKVTNKDNSANDFGLRIEWWEE